MANEFIWDTTPSLNIYAIRWQPGGNAFLTDGASDEVYGAGGNDADDYDVTVGEVGAGSGHYVGHFDISSNIAEGLYPYTYFLRTGGAAADSDRPIARGVIYWTGTAAINFSTIITDLMSAVVEGSITMEQAMRLLLSVATGKSSGGGTGTLTFRNMADNGDRLVVNVDGDGNRTTIVNRDGT
jgi:hypothetical protein